MPVEDYYTDFLGQCGEGTVAVPLQGLLEAVTLPVRGRIEWFYQPYYFPAPLEGEDPGQDPLWLQKTAGVWTRTLREAGGTVNGTWTYTQLLPGGQQAQESITQVTTPLGDRTDHYFRVGDDPDPAYGLPFSPLESAPGRPDLLRSTKVYDCGAGGTNCQLLRTTFVKYHTDSPFVGGPEFNARLEASARFFNDDGNRRATVDLSNFDGLGHYRAEALSGDFESGNARTTVSNFNPTRGTYPGSFVMPTPGEPWVLNTFDYRQTTEGSQISREEFCFEGNTGYLLRRRVLESAIITQGPNDLVHVYSRDSVGNTVREQRYGSHLGSVGLGAVCSIGLGTEQFRMDLTYQFGSLATSQYFNAGGGAMGFFSVNRTIDQSTGLPSSARDPALVQTTFAYDALGRLTSEETGADAKTTYTWILGSGAGFANVKIHRIADGGSTVLADEQLVFDHFGRPMIEKRTMASGARSKRRTFYNALGWVTDVAEWEPDSGGHTAFTRYRNFDPFGRPRRIEPPDGAAHEINLSYLGVREVVRTVKVATGANGVETNAFTTERYDRQGRLFQVVESAGPGGTGVTATYGYDEAGRLSSVGMGGTQNRSFSYDNRGFLTSECHPEKGPSGNGCVTYGLYNAWGLPGRTTDGPNDLRVSYDRAGRPTLIRENGGQQRTLKQWTYGTGIGAGDRSNVKVKTAERYNYVFVGTTPFTDLVRETYTYGGRSGRVSTRLTENFINPQPGSGPSDSFTQSFVWNDLGDPASLGYPHRLGLPVGRTVSFGYSNGTLTSVPGYASSITYHPNGMLNQVVHTNDVTDVWGPDPNKMPRPASIAAWYALGTPSQALRFSSGAYGFDGSGNVETMGSAYFVYNKVSRLVDARLFTGPGGGGGQVQQSYNFDNFGNIQSITTNSVTRNTPTSTSTNRLTSGAYDAAGNLTGYTGALYEYGAFNDIWHYKNGTEEALYLYTASGERLFEFNLTPGKNVNRWTLRDLDGKVLREYSYNRNTFVWTVERDYIYRNGTLLAAETPQGIRHFSVDHLGTPRLATNAFGNQVAYHVYYPFGEEATFFNQDGERMKFTGHERDLHSTGGPGDDLDYMHARYCSPLTGRFLSVDMHRGSPAAPQTMNRYAYVANSPLRYNDPDGRRMNPVTYSSGTGGAPARGVHGRIRRSQWNPSVGRFGWTRNGGGRFHAGLDINARVGTPVGAAETGIVTDVGTRGSAGRRVQITTADGTVLTYAHLDSYGAGVTKGAVLPEGAVVGYAGTSGNAAGLPSEEEHLHLSVADPAGERVNPEEWLNDPSADPPESSTPAETSFVPDFLLPEPNQSTPCTSSGTGIPGLCAGRK